MSIKGLIAWLGAPAYNDHGREYGLAIVKCKVIGEVGVLRSVSALSIYG